MLVDGELPAYRIERRTPGLLHLLRGAELLDVDHEDEGDSRSDIERWGAGVAWAEDGTAIERWDPPDADDDWQVLIGVPFRYVTWRLDDESGTAWDEIDSENRVTRHIEATKLGVYVAAGSLQEVTTARDAGGSDAVRAYEQLYGAVPESAYHPDAVNHMTSVSARDFMQHWVTARRELEAAGPPDK